MECSNYIVAAYIIPQPLTEELHSPSVLVLRESLSILYIQESYSFLLKSSSYIRLYS